MLRALSLFIASSSLTLALPPDTTYNRRDESSTETPGPPGAAHALRDPSKLKYEIVGIVGAYLFWLTATVLLLVFVGKRLRRRAQNATPDTVMTMMKTLQPKEQVVEVRPGLQSPSLKSPTSGKLSSFKSWGRKSHKNNDSIYSTTTLNSTQSYEAQKAKDMDDLTKLYAAVMAHDEEKSQGRNSSGPSPTLPTSPTSPVATSPLSPRYPPEFAHLHNAAAPSIKSPGLNQTVHHAYTPSLKSPTLGQSLHHPMAPTPVGDAFPQDDQDTMSRSSSRTLKTTPLSMISDAGTRVGSIVSSKSRPSRISIRGQTISQPIGSADLHNSRLYDETVPLSPRIYTPGPAPPTPGKKKQVQVAVTPIDEDYADHIHAQHQQEMQSPDGQLYPIQFDPEPYTPQQAAHAQQQLHYQNQPLPHLPQSPRDRRMPPMPGLRSTAMNNAATVASTSAGNGSKVLPFRDMYGDAVMRSAPPTKTTFLERPLRMFSGPKTGVVPSTPYSPYTPNTPMTPITPRRLLGKADLRAKKKQEKLKVLSEDDLVGDDDDVWGSK